MAPPSNQQRDEDAVEGAEATPRRLFVFCDGTWQDGISYYDSGLGNGTSKPAQLIDGATGRGISDKIRNAYSFLSHNYNFAAPSTHTEIYLIGFSRGAFAVQCLASFISQTGLLRSVHLYFLRGLFTLWSRQQLKPWFGADSVATELDGAVADLDPVLREVTIKALVVYDTVSALGVPNPFTPRPMSFVGNQVPKIVEHAFQALALDERRAAFEPVIWKSVEEDDKGTPTVMKQCWFLGSHADVGGNGDAALGALTLLWAVGLLRKHTGVTLDEGEIMRHLKHRLLEWEVRIHPAWRVLKEKSKLSTISSSGKSTDAEIYWWLLGLKSRRSFLEEALGNPNDNMTIHFTVRLALAAKKSKSRLLGDRATRTVQDGDGSAATEGSPVWCQPGKQTGVMEDAVSDKEKVLLEEWTKIGTDDDPAKKQQDTYRNKFVKLRQHINETNDKGEEIHDEKRASFADFLRKNMIFTAAGVPSSGTMYPPLGHQG